MKDYKSYMDNISVDTALHNKIMNRVMQRSQPIPQHFALRRYAAIFTCTVLIFISILAIQHLIPSNTENFSTVQPNDIKPSYTSEKKQYTLIFNHMPSRLSLEHNKKYIPGYFTQELTQDDIKVLLGSAYDNMENRTVKAIAGFSGKGVLDRVTITCEKKSAELITSIQMANGSVDIDYYYPEKPKISDVNGTAVTAGYWENSFSKGKILYYASFELGQTGYYIELIGDESAKEELTTLVNLIVQDGAADLGQITPDFIPKWREDKLTLTEARSDPDFGAYVPKRIPSGLTFESSRRTQNQNQNELRINFLKGMNYMSWTIYQLTDKDRDRIVDINQLKTYHLSLYPIPRADSVPDNLRAIVNNPIFKAEELTFKAVQSRAYTVDDAGDIPGHRMHFSVLYGKIVVEVNVKGAQPKDIFNLLMELNHTH